MCLACLIRNDANISIFQEEERKTKELRKAIGLKPIWTKSDVAFLFGVSEKKVERMVKFDGLPCSVLPNEKGNARFRKVFLRARVLRWLRGREVKESS